MLDAQVTALAGQQFNRFARRQLYALGMTDDAIAHRVAIGRYVIVETGVLAIAPALDHDDWGRWMAATLTEPDSVLSHESAAAAWGFWSLPRARERITRPGSGGPRRRGSVVVHRSSTLSGETEDLQGIPITSVPRTLLDSTARSSRRALARSVREAVRLELTTITELGDALGLFRGRRGAGRLAMAVSRYVGLPVERARSGAEIRALELLRDAGRPMPRLNVRIAGEEADLSWPDRRLIVEIDGGPFHLDVGEDARKERRWREAGWEVRRIAADAVYERQGAFLALTSQ